MEDKYIKIALNQAKRAYKNGDIPVGAVIVKDEKVIAKAYNKREKTKNAINHAEIIAIKKACSKVKDWRLNGCMLFVTLEPCEMCLGAIKQARIDHVVYATPNFNENRNNDVIVKKTFNKQLEEECSGLLRDFFRKRRK